METNTHTIIFDQETPTRLDVFLAGLFPDISRSQIQRLIREQNVRIEDEIITKSGYLLNKRGISVEITLPEPKPLDLQPENIPLDIIYEDENVLVINKPAGMVMHPAAGHSKGTVVHAALGHTTFSEGIGGKMRPGIVHRLDKNTSGVVLLAKNEKAHVWFQKQFKDRKVKKFYIALVDKHPPTDAGKIIAPIYRDRVHRKKMTIAPKGKGKEATTIFRTIKKFSKFSLLEVQILTGRTHQIRVHFSSIGSPITGDVIYGHSTPTILLGRHFLHAKKLEIRLPGNDDLTSFEAELSQELQIIIDDLN